MSFVAKKGPIFTQGRWTHFLFGWAVTATAAMFSDIAMAVTFATVSVLALTWELLTPKLSSTFRWPHPWGDLLDLSAYGAGSLLVIILSGVLARG